MTRPKRNTNKISEFANNFKYRLTSRLFWGRSSLYKTFLHSTVIMVSLIFVISGFINRFAINADTGITSSVSSDVLYSSGESITTIQAANPEAGGIRIRYHVVKENETLEDLAKLYELKKDTIRWANIKLLGPFSENLQVGWELKIPPLDGVLYRVKSGDTITKVAQELQTDILIISEINNIKEPYDLPVGSDIMVPDGRLLNVADQVETVTEDNLIGAFEDPLSNPDCTGYRFFGSINSYPGHNGVDLGHAGCPIRAIAAGKVFYAGWENVSGYTIKIDHGGGVKSYYYHGNGQFYVKTGDYVEQGQEVMFMGCTGNCFGTHLHLTIRLNGRIVDPVKYVPIRF